MTRYKQIIRYKKERVVLSDILPYEVPIIFSNRHFYNFLVDNKIEFKDKQINSCNLKSEDKALSKIISLLTNKVNQKKYKFNETIPFSYKIQHKESEFRELTICHPRLQILMTNFYNLYKDMIIYYCNISKFSIRKPIKKSKFIYFNDTTHNEKLDDSDFIEEQDKEYESLRSFFVYKDYSNIYKFYESDKYYRCEKKYNNLLKLDISKCFDSIYTHSISWAILTKQFAKEHCLDNDAYDFSRIFDKYMEHANYGETHGIIIGPEFSRIFAEIILQSIDRNLYNLLKKNKCYHKKDYEIFRYVDDYFIFYNNETVKNLIVENLQSQLKEYKLSLNTSKSLILTKPIITDLTIAKSKISDFLDQQMKYKVDTKDANEYIYINSKECILKIKIILQETKVSYCDIINYLLGCIENKCKSIIEKYDEIQQKEGQDKKNQREKGLIIVLWNILDFVFFIYSAYPRIQSSVKLCSILNIYFSFFKNRQVNAKYLKHYIFKLIYDNIYTIITKNKISTNAQLETTYLLIPLVELGDEYLIDENILIKYLNFEKVGTCKNINYLSIITILFYIKNNNKYKNLKGKIERIIEFKFKQKKSTIFKDTELILLLFDLLVCPYINFNLKSELLNIYGVKDLDLQTQIIRKRQYWFTQWTNFDFGKAIASKRNQEVY